MRDIDPAWWRTAALNAQPMPRYLRERDFGAVFRFLRSRGWSRSSIAAATGLSETRVREISTGRQRVTSYEVLERLADGLQIERGLVGLAYAPDPLAVLPDEEALPGIDLPPGGRIPAQRTEGSVTLGWPGATMERLLGTLTSALIDPEPDPAAVRAEPSLGEAERATAQAKRNYQACQYDTVLRELPALLAMLGLLQELDDVSGRVQSVASDAYHVAGSVLLKLGDPALAAVAADRSMTAARRSGDPIAIASSARIMTHTLMGTGHGERAQQVAVRAADQLASEVSLASSAQARSVYGALILRGAIAGAGSDREAAKEMLADAESVARELPEDGNERWTAFGPTNVLLHRLNVALLLGDAGAAIDTARQIDISKVALAERRAAFFLDVACAYHEWGRYDEAFAALDFAHRAAPQEIRARPSAADLVTRMAACAPQTTRPRIRSLARSAGIRLQ